MDNLTRDDIKTLRNADSIVFRTSTVSRDRGYPEYETFADCTKRHNPGDGFGERELSAKVAVQQTVATVYSSDGWGSSRVELSGASWVFTSAQYRDTLQTALSLLKPGDSLCVKYVANNNNGHMRDAGLTCDAIELIVYRKAAGDKLRRFTFALDTVVLTPHNLCRNLRFAERPTSNTEAA